MPNPGTTAEKHQPELKDAVNRIGQDVSHLKDDVVGLARTGVDSAKHLAADAKDTVKNTISDARDRAEDATDSMKKYIAKNPMTSVGIALGVGLVLGVVCFRPRS